ncbi:hypothetical protein FJV76_14315 [Mesorhizobium sp. WSM4303]|uniref:spike base protein, RCAP_Rcc01079 family n=1 Tax=Mesorhizobium sp. WSM4303 TaxID=2589887 RepID=UPI00115D1EE5|nr:hypothetical protein [Mesorhizobium sp. WSM4303]TRD03808.1 hypothetical protein FJV76_14315 [Mesorhizobium sp. WSM4303]
MPVYSQASSANNGAAIVKSDSTVVAFDAIYVGGAGDVVVKTYAGDTLTFTAPPVGTIIPIRCNRVMAATTATLLVGLSY